jgi:DNA primase
MIDLLRSARRSAARVEKKGISAPESVYVNRGGDGTREEIRPPDPWEAALCYLLWTDERKRSAVDPTYVLSLLSEDGAKTVALSILSGESIEELRSRWAEADDPYPMRLISTGWAHCESNGESGEIWEIVVSALESKRSRDKFASLKEKHARGEATHEEMKEYLELARKLKGGSGKT